MLTALDHIIIGVDNLEAATETFSDKLGLIASGGGVHPEGGTANRIIVIGDTYLELITVRKPKEAQESMLARLAKGNGYLNFVLASDDILKDSAQMRGKGVPVIGPRSGELASSDGRSRAWQRVDVERPDLTQHYPFLIQHDSSGEERRFRLAGWTNPPEHPLGATRIQSTTIAVDDLGEAATRFQGIYGVQASELYSGEIDHWDAMLVSFLLHSTMQSFELATPLPAGIDPADEEAALPEPGALRQYLNRFGESLCRMTLAVENLAASRRYLDTNGVVYTYFEEPHPVLWIHPMAAFGASIVLHEFTPELPVSNPLIP